MHIGTSVNAVVSVDFLYSIVNNLYFYRVILSLYNGHAFTYSLHTRDVYNSLDITYYTRLIDLSYRPLETPRRDFVEFVETIVIVDSSILGLHFFFRTVASILILPYSDV